MDSFLIDTHTFIWYAIGDKRLSGKAKSHIDSSAAKCISVASLWEMAIKSSLGKLTFNAPFNEVITDQIQINNYQILAAEKAHIFKIHELPFHHRDPFDRLMIAQAQIEDLPIISADKKFDSYDLKRVW